MTCVQCENGKSISPIDSVQPTMAHDADTGSDLALLPDGKHPSARHATPAMLLRSATGVPPAMLWRTRVPVTRSEATVEPVERWMEAARTTRRSRRSGPADDRAQPAEGREQEDRGRIRADDVHPERWRSIHQSDDGRDTRRASEHCMCVLHMHMGRYDHPEVVLTLFRSIRFQRCR